MAAAGSHPVLALSDDGRYGLIALPFAGPLFPLPFARPSSAYSFALISTRDGFVEQFFSMERGNPEFGFASGSRRMWIHNGAVTGVYEMQ